MKEKKEVIPTRLFRLIVFLGCYVYIMYSFLPNVIFYFDKIESKATVELIRKNRMKIVYFHKRQEKSFSVERKEYHIDKLKKIKAINEWNIFYSNHFPALVYIVGIDENKNITPYSSFFIILIVSIFIVFLLIKEPFYGYPSLVVE